MSNKYLEKVAISNQDYLKDVEPMLPHINKATTYDTATGGKVGALVGSALGASAGLASGAPLSALAGAALGGVGGWIGGSLAGAAIGIPHGIVNSMIAERQLRQDLRAKEDTNKYLIKVASNNLVEAPISGWNPDSYGISEVDLLQAREAYLRAKLMTKSASETPSHDYKPALAAGAIDAGMGVGLGTLGSYISKKHFNGKYAPLLIGGMEGTAAMTATDIFQRKHEKELQEAKSH